ncbi:lysine exporter LysO family protein [Anaerotruncus sp. 80]|uniref:Lysine exporter LysO family protein n=2 Tax=Oscillospiraceae TaxID=216572 RepID=A0A845QHC1_9FIRM|nr:lysine exporter LysO family protein [Anaerotruncus colihominis]NCF00949.1 lysine exporter LysO family protein [Anaerotruncus sp. 80]
MSKNRRNFMAYVLLYLTCMIICYFVASKLRNHREILSKIINVVTLASVFMLVLMMGMRMGSNEEIIASLGTIGLQAFIFTIVVVIGGVFSVMAARKLLGIDKFGRLKAQAKGQTNDEIAESEAEADTEEGGGSAALMTWLIIIAVVLGLLFGYFYLRVNVADIDGFNDKVGNVMTLGLCIMIGSIGFDMGLSGTVIAQVKHIGFRVLIFPAAVIVGTAVSSVIMSFFLPLSVRECIAIGFGFGWYTFAPVAISSAGHVMAGAVSFMHNVFRETFGIILLPILAKKIGYIEACSLPGVAAGDMGLSLVEKALRPDIVVYSFAIGMSESILIPLLVTLAIGV